MGNVWLRLARVAACTSILMAMAACGGGGSASTTGQTGTASSGSSSTGSSQQSGNTNGGTTPKATTGSVTLSWQAPTQNTDGSTLTNLSGYRIHYGTEPGQYSNTIDIDNPGITRYVIDNLPAATYYFALTSMTSDGVESSMSGEASKTIG